MQKGVINNLASILRKLSHMLLKEITVRFVLTLALNRNCELQQIDINNEFLNISLQEVVYMIQSPDFEQEDLTLVYELNKNLYVLSRPLGCGMKTLLRPLLILDSSIVNEIILFSFILTNESNFMY